MCITAISWYYCTSISMTFLGRDWNDDNDLVNARHARGRRAVLLEENSWVQSRSVPSAYTAGYVPYPYPLYSFKKTLTDRNDTHYLCRSFITY